MALGGWKGLSGPLAYLDLLRTGKATQYDARQHDLTVQSNRITIIIININIISSLTNMFLINTLLLYIHRMNGCIYIFFV